MALSCVLTFLVAFSVSTLGLLALERWAGRLGLVDHPGGRKIHSEPTPLGGGLAIGLGTVLPILGGYLLACWGTPGWLGGRLAAFVRTQQPFILARGLELLSLLGGGAVILLLGLADDRWNLGAKVRLAAQTAVAVAVFLLAPQVRITFFSASPVAWGVFTVVWIVAITNSFNLLDNMDGLSSGVALVATLLLLAGALATGQWFMALFLLAFGGATGAFLLRNFAPARIFAGSAGGYFFGFVLAVSTIRFTFYEQGRSLWAALAPLLVLSVAIYDTASVIFIRLREGRPIMEGDRSHLSHRLVALGMSRRGAVLTIYLIAFAAGCPALFLLPVGFKTLLVFAQSLAVLGLLAILEVVGHLEADPDRGTVAHGDGALADERPEGGSGSDEESV